MTDISETCPRCKGFVWHRREPCECMVNAKPNPGHWAMRIAGSDTAIMAMSASGCVERIGRFEGPNQAANAQLAVTAPELLECLKDALEMLHIAGKGQESKTVRKWQAAIARAEGSA